MPITLIEQNPSFEKKVEGDVVKLAISEMFVDTIQGEGINIGHPTTFIRLQGCTLECVWCDTLDVWPNGNQYTIQEVLDLLSPHAWKYVEGMQHIILTGGSPLKQEFALVEFVHAFRSRFGFHPYIEVENEVVIKPSIDFIRMVSCWNNSPKLANSGMKYRARHKPGLLEFMDKLQNSWFKFVVSTEEDWEEILNDFLPYISREKVILMPQAQTQQELLELREKVVEIAIKHQVRFSDRLHVTIWNKKTGV